MAEKIETCATCRFYAAQPVRSCHRYPPWPSKNQQAVWAAARPEDFCGEWKRKPKSGLAANLKRATR